jgi:hypothetical protein
MKKLSMLFHALALILAITAAFAFKTDDVVQNGYIDGSGNCQTTSSQCSGNNQTCQLDVPEDPAIAVRQVGIFASNCTGLQMN